jgi:uridine kinase
VTPLLVGITGGSGSGKSSLARRLADDLEDLGACVLAHDAYYLDRGALPPAARAALDYDTPEALDGPLFRDHLQALRAGLPVRPPRYSFATHPRLGEGETIAPRGVVIVDGLLILCDPAVRILLDLSVFVDAPADVRLGRRLARDTGERGRTRESVMAQFASTVTPAHERFVAPCRAHADLVVANLGTLEGAVATVADAVRRAHVRRGAGARVGEVA